ncbi:hypothetical protein BJX76DRAFT_368471 [Aspergillus varians]
MAFLPAELNNLIVGFIRDAPPPKNQHTVFRGFVRPAKLAQYAAVSRQWQAIVERMIWREISIMKVGSLDQLKELTSVDPHRCARRGYIRRIIWSPEFKMGELSDQVRGDKSLRVQRLPDWYLRQFRRSLLALFQVLDTWKDRNTDLEFSPWLGGGEYIEIPDEDQAEIEYEEWVSLDLDRLWRKGEVAYSLHLTADEVEDIPSLPHITCFSLEDIGDTDVRPSTFFHLLTRFPHVRHVSGGESRWISPKALQALLDQRQELVDHLSLVPESEETFTYSIGCQREMAINPARNAANYISSQGLDELSIAFRTLSMRLRELHFDYGVRVSSALFWPVAEERVDKRSLYWPRLEVLKVIDVPPYTADGEWILDNDPEKDCVRDVEDDSLEPWSYFCDYYAERGLIKSREVDRLYEAMGLAARRMPRLRQLEFSFRGEFSELGNTDWLKFRRDLVTGKTMLSFSTDWEYAMGEKVTSAWGLEGEKADEFQRTGSVSLNQWP